MKYLDIDELYILKDLVYTEMENNKYDVGYLVSLNEIYKTIEKSINEYDKIEKSLVEAGDNE